MLGRRMPHCNPSQPLQAAHSASTASTTHPSNHPAHPAHPERPARPCRDAVSDNTRHRTRIHATPGLQRLARLGALGSSACETRGFFDNLHHVAARFDTSRPPSNTGGSHGQAKSRLVRSRLVRSRLVRSRLVRFRLVRSRLVRSRLRCPALRVVGVGREGLLTPCGGGSRRPRVHYALDLHLERRQLWLLRAERGLEDLQGAGRNGMWMGRNGKSA